MKYVSIDIKTTGLNKDNHQILEIGAIIEDTTNILSFEKLPKFECIIEWEELVGSVFAINMNSRIIKILTELSSIKDEDKKKLFRKKYNILHPHDVATKFYHFLYLNRMIKEKNLLDNAGGYAQMTDNGQIVPMINKKTIPAHIYVAGKNFASFDAGFLNKLPNFSDFIKFHYRIIDPGSIFINMINDNDVPSLSECKKRAGLENTTVSYNALEDAWDVVQVLRTKY